MIYYRKNKRLWKEEGSGIFLRWAIFCYKNLICVVKVNFVSFFFYPRVLSRYVLSCVFKIKVVFHVITSGYFFFSWLDLLPKAHVLFYVQHIPLFRKPWLNPLSLELLHKLDLKALLRYDFSSINYNKQNYHLLSQLLQVTKEMPWDLVSHRFWSKGK